jgi:hypothetical protein
MALVDVEGRGGIDYHAFLARLAPKVTHSAHALPSVRWGPLWFKR